jgi:hypothetical protein
LKCGTTLRHGTQRMECPTCGAHWPLDQSIPSYGSANYYGEVTQEAMHGLIALAERGHWLTAVRTMFRDSKPELAGLSFVERAENVVLVGPPGVGKTHLAIALGVKAVEAGHSVLFLTLESLMGRRVRTRHENRLDRTLQQLAYRLREKKKAGLLGRKAKAPAELEEEEVGAEA